MDLLVLLFPGMAKKGEGLPMQTIDATVKLHPGFALLWAGLIEYKASILDEKKQELIKQGKDAKNLPTPEASAAKCLRASLKFKFDSLSKRKSL